MAEAPKTATIITHRRVAPPPTSPEQSLPATFFDMVWLHFHPIQRLLFYEFPCSKTQFLQEIVPDFEKSLSQTLKHFLPLAGNLIYPLNSAELPGFRYVTGDSVFVTIAESTDDFDFNYLTGNGIRNADDYYAFTPDLPQPEMEPGTGVKKIPVLALQLTLFPGSGISIGFTNHHSVGDASSIVRFIKAWSSVAKLGKENDNYDGFVVPNHLLPFYDRSVIKDESGLGIKFWKQMELFKIESPPLIFPTNRVRGTYVLQKNDICNLKNLVLSRKPDPVHLSSFTIATAYIWACLAKSASWAGEKLSDDEPEHFCFAVDGRARLDPPAPMPYFGNCVALVKTETTHGKLKGDEGFLVAVELIGELISKKVNKKGELMKDAGNWMEGFGNLIDQRCLGVAGSPRFDMYDVDFGWGLPNKFECVSIDGDGGAMSLCMSREFEGGLEIGFSMSREKMEAFGNVFFDGLRRM